MLFGAPVGPSPVRLRWDLSAFGPFSLDIFSFQVPQNGFPCLRDGLSSPPSGHMECPQVNFGVDSSIEKKRAAYSR